MMRTVSKHEYEGLLEKSEVLMRDRHGVKVIRLPDGNFFKTFWCRHLFSSRRIYPEWLRFSLHADSLKRRGIPTVTLLEAIRIPHLKRTGVIYLPLEGRTLRQVAASGEFDAALAGRLGEFMARLHRKGIHFHSLHLGNVLLGPEGDFGLIDISDMRVFLWPLSTNTRLRNFVHLFRYKEDLQILTEAGFQGFLEGYSSRGGSPHLEKKVTELFSRYSGETP